MNVEGGVFVVTGGGSGSGRAVARELTARGATALVWGRSVEKLKETVAAGDAAAWMQVDVTSAKQIETAFAQAVERYGRPTGLVHCAGIWTPGKLEEVTEATAIAHLTSVVLGTVLCVRQALRVMHGNDGRIVQIAAASAKAGFSETALNMIAKRAQDGLQEGLATEIKGSGIRLTTVYPDNIGKPGSDKVIGGKAMSYDDVAAAVLWALEAPDTTWVQEILMTSPLNPRLG